MTLKELYATLDLVLPKRVTYGVEQYDGDGNPEPPYICYQETSKRTFEHRDDGPLFHSTKIQITLVTKRKDVSLETKLENALDGAGLPWSLLREYRNGDETVSRAYETSMEDF